MNLNILTAFQQAVLAILIILGNVVFVSTSVVVIRLYFFRKKLAHIVEHSAAGRKLQKHVGEAEANSSQPALPDPDLGQIANIKTSNGSSPLSTDDISHSPDCKATTFRRRMQEIQRPPQSQNRRRHHQTGRGFFPAPWQISSIRKAFHRPTQKLGEQLHTKSHHYVSFEPQLDHKASLSRPGTLNQMLKSLGSFSIFE